MARTADPHHGRAVAPTDRTDQEAAADAADEYRKATGTRAVAAGTAVIIDQPTPATGVGALVLERHGSAHDGCTDHHDQQRAVYRRQETPRA